MKAIIFGNHRYFIKTSYSEMTQLEFLKICWLRKKYLHGDIPVVEYDAMRIAAFATLCNLTHRHILQIQADQWADLLPHVDYVFTDAPDMDKNLLPTISRGRFFRKYVGPTGMLDKSSIYELAEADTAFISASNSGAVEKMYLLASILYRPKRRDIKAWKNSSKYNGDIREPFNKERSVARLRKMKRIPFHYIVGVYIYYHSFREQMIQNPLLKPIWTGKDKTEGMNLGWVGTILSVSGDKFGSLDETKEQNWLVVMVHIANEMDKARQLKEAMDKKGKK